MLKGEERGAPFSLVLYHKNAFGRVLKVFTLITVNAGYQPKHLHLNAEHLFTPFTLSSRSSLRQAQVYAGNKLSQESNPLKAFC